MRRTAWNHSRNEGLKKRGAASLGVKPDDGGEQNEDKSSGDKYLLKGMDAAFAGKARRDATNSAEGTGSFSSRYNWETSFSSEFAA